MYYMGEMCITDVLHMYYMCVTCIIHMWYIWYSQLSLNINGCNPENRCGNMYDNSVWLFVPESSNIDLNHPSQCQFVIACFKLSLLNCICTGQI